MNSFDEALDFTFDSTCSELRKGVLCFRSMRYRDGEPTPLLHHHVRAHRMGQDARLEALRALAGQAAEWPAIFLLSSRLNDRPGSPAAFPLLTCNASFLWRPGVVRYTVSADRSWACFDEVVNAERYNQSLIS